MVCSPVSEIKASVGSKRRKEKGACCLHGVAGMQGVPDKEKYGVLQIVCRTPYFFEKSLEKVYLLLKPPEQVPLPYPQAARHKR